MSLSEVNAALKEDFSAPAAREEQSCFYLELKRHPDTAIMMLDGHVARVDVSAEKTSESSTPTAKGIRIGDTEEEVKRVYGNSVVVSPHHYSDGHYLTVRSGRYAIRFETDQNRVTSFYGGRSDAIELVEGCS